ncbi:MAG TPA: hypothetical protein VKF14_14570 [Candidatus Dormibacteraeota bacterium]|nr:hypothetical protein [Candidatus Dormibacteraeota bacterium]
MAGSRAELNLEMTRAGAFRRAEEALIIAGGIINFRDSAAGRLAATVPMSFKSFGETVDVDISGTDGDVRVSIESTSRLRTTLFDWRKNSENVERVASWIKLGDNRHN